MSAPHIPNLLSRGNSGPRSRGRGQGRSTRGGPSSSGSAIRDQTVQSTDTDAAVSRLSAVSMGYLDDEYAQYFVKLGAGTRRLPIINRGTYVRTTALDILINSFITSTSSSPGPKQIISLGAGTDTRYFRLRARNKHHNVIYHEFDFPLVCDTKRQIVRNHENVFLKEAVMFEDIQQPQDGGNEEGRGEWGIACSVTVDDTPLTQLDADKAAEKAKENKKQYFCHPLDLRHLPTLPSHTSIPGLRPNIPTLIISECCLCYLDPSIASDVIAWFKNKIEALAIILYEPINPDDAFGQMMVGNLKARGIVMPTVGVYRSLGDQVARMRAAGFGGDGDEGIGEGGAEARTVERIWERWITDEERERVDGLEGLDEVEEWQMLARHYAVVWGWTKTLVWELPASVGVGKSS